MKKGSFRAKFRGNVIAGLFVIIPLGAVVWVLKWMLRFLEGLPNLLPAQLSPRSWVTGSNPFLTQAVDFLTTISLLILIVLILWGIGFGSRLYLGKQIVEWISRFVSKVPVLKTVYTTLEQLLNTFASGSYSKNFSRVVEVEYPRVGVYSLALVTGRRANGILTIFVPTTPNPTSGFYLRVPEKDVKDLDITVEDAFKEIISMGLVYKDGKEKLQN